MFEKLWSSLFDKGNVIFIYFGLGLSNYGSDILLLLYFSEFYVSVECSSLISSVISITNILPGVPLFSLFCLVYAIIRISTIEVKANTQQVLAVSDLTGKPLWLHIPSWVASCLPDWVPGSMSDPWVKVSRLSGLPSPKQQTVLLGEIEVSYGFFVNKRLTCPLLASLGNWKKAALDCRETQNVLKNVFNLLLSLQLMGLLGPKAI